LFKKVMIEVETEGPGKEVTEGKDSVSLRKEVLELETMWIGG